MVQEKRGVLPYLTYVAVSGALNIPRLLPYKARLSVVATLAARVIGPVAESCVTVSMDWYVSKLKTSG